MLPRPGYSQDTEAIAIVVSETTGEVRVFQKGRCVMQMHPKQRHQRGLVDEGGHIAWRAKGSGWVKGGLTDGMVAADPGKEAAESKEAKEAREKEARAKEIKDLRDTRPKAKDP